ncbi:N-acetyl-D-Glu racemase DgcA [Methylobacterium sp. A54F]
MSRRLTVAVERFPIAGAFTIARGSRTEAVVVTATVADDTERPALGRGECVPYARYGESPESVAALIEAQAEAVAAGLTRAELLERLPAGAARNALDCALFDLEAKLVGRPAWELAGLTAPAPAVTAYTLSLGSPESMEAAARAAADRPLLKVKLGGAGDPERIAAVRRGAPAARLIVDANEAWRRETLEANLAACVAAGVGLIEQPLPAGEDALLAEIARPIPLCADESLHDRSGLDALSDRYDAINIKLDKTGGLTEAVMLAHEARARGLALMVGCMVGTSLAMAPAMLLAHHADYVDLDGPLLLARDREPALRFAGSTIHPPDADLWG